MLYVGQDLYLYFHCVVAIPRVLGTPATLGVEGITISKRSKVLRRA
jgi:hypothetical protein